MQRRLAAVAELRALPPPVLTRLEGAAVERALPRGALAYREGDPAEHLFAVRSGTIKLCVSGPDGRETVSALVGPTEVFGEGFEPLRSHDARAVEPTRVLLLPRSVLRDEPSYAYLLDRRLARTLHALHHMTAADTRGRIAARIMDLTERQGRPVGDGTLVGVRITQDDLGRMVGASRETVNKVLALFRRRGWLRSHGQRLVVTDEDALRELGGG